MTDDHFAIAGYEPQRLLGQGGMASVWLAHEVSTGRRVAIKLLSRGAGDEATQKRFLLEGETLARLPHPNIVQVLEVVHELASSYIVMECLEGGVLSQRMQTGWLTLADHVGFVVQIAGALQYAHEHGVVHRDLKPDNILFRDARTPVLTDFGIARLRHDLTDSRITETGMVVGTPTYMSPEQATGQEVDGRSDQYALGVLFYEMLAGAPPFVGETAMQLAYAHVHTPPPSLPVGQELFEPIVQKMLAKQAADRYPDLKAFVVDLRMALSMSPMLQQRLRFDERKDITGQLRSIGFSDEQLASRTRPALSAVDVPQGLKHALLEKSHLALEPIEERRVERRHVGSRRVSLPVAIAIILVVIVVTAMVVKSMN